ncbi:MAG: universal stress protein [Nitrospirota bacterium]|jgi:nucleotide-binding universal stress UspA family protein
MAEIGSFNNLFVASDGSEFSEGAVTEALKLAKECSAKLTALTVVEVNPEFESYAPDAMEKIEEEARAYVESVKDKADKEGLACDILVSRSENPYEAIVEEAQKANADVIVLGRRGRTGIKRLLMGSVTARVIGHSPVSVLVVPRAAELKFKNILVATDGSSYSEAAALKAVGLAKCSGGSITALAIADVMGDSVAMKAVEESVRKVTGIAEKEGVKAEALVEKGKSADEAIVDIARQRGCDLVVVGSHGRSGLKRLLMGSVAERVVGHAECAVMVVKAKE